MMLPSKLRMKRKLIGTDMVVIRTVSDFPYLGLLPSLVTLHCPTNDLPVTFCTLVMLRNVYAVQHSCSVADLMNRHATYAARPIVPATDVAGPFQWHATYAARPIVSATRCCRSMHVAIQMELSPTSIADNRQLQYERTWQWTVNNSFLVSALDVIFSLFVIFPEQFASHYMFHAKTNIANWRLWSVMYQILLERRYGIINNDRIRVFRHMVCSRLGGRGAETDEFRGECQAALILLLDLCPPATVQHSQQWAKKCIETQSCKFCKHKPAPPGWHDHTHMYMQRSQLDQFQLEVNRRFSEEGSHAEVICDGKYWNSDTGVWQDVCKCCHTNTVCCKSKDNPSCLAIFTLASINYFPHSPIPNLRQELPYRFYLHGKPYQLVNGLFHNESCYYSVSLDVTKRNNMLLCNPFVCDSVQATAQPLQDWWYHFAPSPIGRPVPFDDLFFVLYVDAEKIQYINTSLQTSPNDWDPYENTTYIRRCYDLWNNHQPLQFRSFPRHKTNPLLKLSQDDKHIHKKDICTTVSTVDFCVCNPFLVLRSADIDWCIQYEGCKGLGLFSFDFLQHMRRIALFEGAVFKRPHAETSFTSVYGRCDKYVIDANDEYWIDGHYRYNPLTNNGIHVGCMGLAYIAMANEACVDEITNSAWSDKFAGKIPCYVASKRGIPPMNPVLLCYGDRREYKDRTYYHMCTSSGCNNAYKTVDDNIV